MTNEVKQTQKSKILNYIYDNGSATVRELFIYCNINSPTKRLSELRKMGFITERTFTKTKADGKTVKYNKYYLTHEGLELMGVFK